MTLWEVFAKHDLQLADQRRLGIEPEAEVVIQCEVGGVMQGEMVVECKKMVLECEVRGDAARERGEECVVECEVTGLLEGGGCGRKAGRHEPHCPLRRLRCSVGIVLTEVP